MAGRAAARQTVLFEDSRTAGRRTLPFLMPAERPDICADRTSFVTVIFTNGNRSVRRLMTAPQMKMQAGQCIR